MDNIDDLLFFIVTRDARAVVRQRMASEREIELWIGLADAAQPALCLIENSPAVLQNWGDDALANALQQQIRHWVNLGRPDPRRVRLTACPVGAAPAPGKDEWLLRCRGFDCLVSWPEPDGDE